jgi:Spy/CpxP family protein refolding chaperone
MRSLKWGIALAFLLLLGSTTLLHADDAPATQPSTQPADEPPKKVRLFKPYSALTDLTDDQKAKIADIHKTYLAAMHAAADEQKSDIDAILTDDQKKELEAAAAGDKTTKKEAKVEKSAAAADAPGDAAK